MINNVSIDECKFPYIDKKTGKYIYKCSPKPNGHMCPTKLDYTRTKADNWGYCPENINKTKSDLKVIEVMLKEMLIIKNLKKVNVIFHLFIKMKIKDNKNDKDNKMIIIKYKDNKNEPKEEYKLKYNCNEYQDNYK